MTAHVLISGSLWKNPEQRSSSRTGKLFTVATIRAGSDDGGGDFWSITAFSESAQAELLRLSAGDALSAQGKAKFEIYTSNNGTAKISRSIVADAILPLRPAPRTTKAKAARPAPTQDSTTTTTATDPDLNDEKSTTMISKEQIETYAAQIGDSDFNTADIKPLIGHLSNPEFHAVLDRAKEITRARGRAAMAEADSLENVLRLAQAAGMPAGEKPVRWLAERGLIEKIGEGWRFKKAKPASIG